MQTFKAISICSLSPNASFWGTRELKVKDDDHTYYLVLKETHSSQLQTSFFLPSYNIQFPNTAVQGPLIKMQEAFNSKGTLHIN